MLVSAGLSIIDDLSSYNFRVIYPHSYGDMIRAGRTDEELLEILKIAHLAFIVSREGGWETRKEWKDVFSGGEKQRVCLVCCNRYDSFFESCFID